MSFVVTADGIIVKMIKTLILEFGDIVMMSSISVPSSTYTLGGNRVSSN